MNQVRPISDGAAARLAADCGSAQLDCGRREDGREGGRGRGKEGGREGDSQGGNEFWLYHPNSIIQHFRARLRSTIVRVKRESHWVVLMYSEGEGVLMKRESVV